MDHNTKRYTDRLMSEASLQLVDEGERPHEHGHVPLTTMARDPRTIAAVNRAREVADKDRWEYLHAGRSERMTDAERAAASAVWQTMPGYTCLADAVVITARL